MYTSVVRPAMLYGMETVAVTKRQVGKMEVAELKMVRWALGVTRKDKIRNEYVRGTAKIAKLGDKLWNGRLRWYGHVKWREEGYVGKTMMEMTVPGRKKRGRPRRRWMNLAREDMERVGAKEGDEVDRKKWKILSRCGDPELGEAERRRKRRIIVRFEKVISHKTTLIKLLFYFISIITTKTSLVLNQTFLNATKTYFCMNLIITIILISAKVNGSIN